jgi:hypothetical protein
MFNEYKTNAVKQEALSPMLTSVYTTTNYI